MLGSRCLMQYGCWRCWEWDCVGGGGGEEAGPREVVEGKGEGAPGGLVAGGVEAGADVEGRELAEGGVADG